jgi:hypothetical protein
VAHARKNGSIIVYDAAYALYISDRNCPKSIFEIEGEIQKDWYFFVSCSGFVLCGMCEQAGNAARLTTTVNHCLCYCFLQSRAVLQSGSDWAQQSLVLCSVFEIFGIARTCRMIICCLALALQLVHTLRCWYPSVADGHLCSVSAHSCCISHHFAKSRVHKQANDCLTPKNHAISACRRQDVRAGDVQAHARFMVVHHHHVVSSSCCVIIMSSWPQAPRRARWRRAASASTRASRGRGWGGPSSRTP